MSGFANVLRRWAADIDPDSPFYASCATAVAECDDLVARIESVPPGRHHPTLLFAAMHDIVLAGTEHPIAAAYRRAEPGPAAGADFVDACDAMWPDVRDRLEHRNTQTNEPNRASVLRPAIAYAAGDRPIALIDVGTSAGLTLMVDRYAYDYEPGGRTFGDRRSAVRLACHIRKGDPPVERDVVIGYRVGLDTEPVDVHDEREVRWLRACLWPGQRDRDERLTAALRAIRLDPPPVLKADAVDALPETLAAIPAGLIPVVVTTWILAYLGKPRRAAFADALETASRERPVLWVSLEASGVVPLLPAGMAPEGTTDSVLGLVRFASDTVDARVLGVAHPHGNWLDWLAS